MPRKLLLPWACLKKVDVPRVVDLHSFGFCSLTFLGRNHAKQGLTFLRHHCLTARSLIAWRVYANAAATESYLSALWNSLKFHFWVIFSSHLPWPATTPFCANFPSGSMRIASTAGCVCWGMLNLRWKIFLLGYIFFVFDEGLLLFLSVPFHLCSWKCRQRYLQKI